MQNAHPLSSRDNFLLAPSSARAPFETRANAVRRTLASNGRGLSALGWFWPWAALTLAHRYEPQRIEWTEGWP